MKEKATIFDYARMCKNTETCDDCPLRINNAEVDMACSYLMREIPDKANEIILNWCKEQPVETRQDRFLKMFPKAVTNGNGRISICPKNVDKTHECELEPNECASCMDKYWLAEVEENERERKIN